MPMPAFNDNPNDYLESHKIRKVQNDQPPQSPPPQKRREIDVTPPPPFLKKNPLKAHVPHEQKYLSISSCSLKGAIITIYKRGVL